MKPYQPSHKMGATGLPWLIGSALVGGSAIGIIVHLISLWFYLVIIFPVAMGLGGGAVTGLAVHRGKVRQPKVAAVFGVLTGLMVYGTMQVADYFQFRRMAAQEITRELGSVEANLADKVVNLYLLDETGAVGFVGYLKHSAQEGVSIGRVGSSGMNLGETGSWIYWAIELMMIASISGWVALGAAKEPFCEPCDRWYGNKKLLGQVPLPPSESFVKLVQTEQFKQAAALIEPPSADQQPRLEIEVDSCPCCSFGDLSLVIKEIAFDDKGKIKYTELAQGMISPGQYSQLQQAE